MADPLTIKQIELEKGNDSVIEFLRLNVQARMDRKVYQWEYFFKENESVFVTANKKDEVVCTQSFLLYYLQRGREIIKTSKSENSFLSPEFRGTSTFKDVYFHGLKVCEEKDQKMVWGFTPAAKVWEKKLEFEVDPNVSCDFRTVINFPNTKYGVLRFFFYLAQKALYGFKRNLWLLGLGYNSKIKGFDIEELPRNYSELEELYYSTRGKDDVIIKLNEEYFKWRILQNPVLNYRTKFFYYEGKLQGFYIYSVKKNESSDTAQLSEVVAKDPKVKSLIMAHLFKSLKKEKTIFIEYFGNLKNASNQKTFKDLTEKIGGRMIKNEHFAFVVKSLNNFEVPSSEKWNFNALWTEGFDR
jgi:hypothetical protein